MKTNFETGHYKNVANFDDLTSFCTGYGAAYNPSKTSIKLTALQTLSTNARNAITAVNTAIPPYTNAVSARELAFGPLKPLITRIGNALKATDATEQVIGNVRTLTRKLLGKRVTPFLTDAEKQALAAEGKKEVTQISSSQMSYDNQLDNFDKLIKLLATIPLYVPNEADLKITALTTLYNDLKAKNAAVVAASIPLSNARISRNDILYKVTTGICDVAQDVKNYIKSVFGANSPQYKQVSGLQFRISKI